MAQEIRQNNLFAAEDFQAIYASFANSNFKVYDYDTIARGFVLFQAPLVKSGNFCGIPP